MSSLAETYPSEEENSSGKKVVEVEMMAQRDNNSESGSNRRSARKRSLSVTAVLSAEPAVDETNLQWMNRVAMQKIVRSLPVSTSADLNDLDDAGWAFGTALAHIVFYVTILLYFVISGTIAEQGKKYLALERPNKALATCSPVPVSVTGTYFADWHGLWSSEKEYDLTKPIYQLDFVASTITPDEYSAAMLDFAGQLKTIGEKQAGYDIISALIAWDSFQASPNYNTNMHFRPYSEVSSTLSGMVITDPPTLSSKEGVCDTSQIEIPTYSTSSMLLTTSFPIIKFKTSTPTLAPTTRTRNTPSSFPTKQPTGDDDALPPVQIHESCPNQISIGGGTFDLKKFASRSTQSPTFGIDMRTVLLAFAVNMGIIDVNQLTLAIAENFTIGSVRFYKTYYISSNFPGSARIRCFTSLGKPRACFAIDEARQTYIYPVITTISSDHFCSCPGDMFDDWCNDGKHIQLALVFSKSNNDFDTIEMGWRMQQMIEIDPTHGPDQVKELVAGLAYTSGYVAYLPKAELQKWKDGKRAHFENGTLADLPSYDSFAANFTRLGNNISIISYNIFFQGRYASINSDGVQLLLWANKTVNNSDWQNRVTCLDTIYQPDVLARITAIPPVPLVQPYFSCTNTLRSSFVNAVGVAAGNSALISSIFLAVTLTAIVFYNNKAKRGAQKIVAPSHKARLLAAQDKREKDQMRAEYREALRAMTSVMQRLVETSSSTEKEALQSALGAISDTIPLPAASPSGSVEPRLSTASTANPMLSDRRFSSPAGRLSLSIERRSVEKVNDDASAKPDHV